VVASGFDPKRSRGRHRIFLGYAAGVGKTYAMLVEARLRADRGEDVVIGYLGPHVRRETRELAVAMDQISPARIAYHGSEFGEVDVEAVFDRNPQWVVIDELAHSNTPGSRNEKRWQSVEAILDAGVGVLSTVNVQHIQSLNDFVYQVSGVRVAETIPDEAIEAAEVVIVDTDPNVLLARVKRGLVVPPDEVGQALTHFFRKPTLDALRARSLSVGLRTSNADSVRGETP
jgi:two-component system sensor histidine kinase KdpD